MFVPPARERAQGHQRMLDSPGACSHLFRRVQDAGRECEAGNFGRKDWERGGRDLVHCIQQIGQMLLAEQQEMQKEGKKAAAGGTLILSRGSQKHTAYKEKRDR